MAKKEYILPDLSVVTFSLRDVIMSSPEDLNSHIDSSDVISDPIIEDDPGIDW